MFQTKVVETIKTHFIFNNFFRNPAIYELMCNNIVEPGRPHMTIWHKCFAYWITKFVNTNSEYVTHCFSTATMVA
jgi:hypothetical protein